MICNKCGARNDDDSNFCKNCAAPLKNAAASEPVDESPRYVDAPENSESTNGRSASWGFVRAPKWPKPDFNASSISDEEVAESASKAEEPRACAYSSRRAQSEPDYSASDEDYEYESVTYVDAPDGEAEEDDLFYDDYEEDDLEPAAPRPRTSAPYRTRQQRIEEDEFSDDFAPRRRHSHRGSRSHKASSGSSKRNTILFWAAAVVLVLLMAFFAILLIYKDKGGISAFFGNLFGATATREAEMTETTMDDGSPAYAVTVYAKDGCTVRFTYPNGDTQDIPVTNGRAAARVPVSVWTPTDPCESSPVSVTPNFSIVDEEGNVTPVELPDISIEVPAVTITLTEPSLSEVEVSSSAVTFAGTLSEADAALFINDTQFAVNEDGSFSGTYNLTEAGTTTLTFEGRKGGYVIGRAEVAVTLSEEATPAEAVTEASTIALADDGTLRSKGDTLTVKGTMEVGSTVTVTGAVSGEPVVDSAAGTFTFTASTPEAGKSYTATITATKDGKTTTKEFTIDRAPDYKAYVESAWKMDYDSITAVPSQSQAYLITGTVAEIIESTRERILAKVDVGSGNLVVVEYHPAYSTAGTITADGAFTGYGYPAGVYEGTSLPKMFVWFVNN